MGGFFIFAASLQIIMPMSVYFTSYPTPLGELTILSDGTSLCELHFSGQKHFDDKALHNVISNSDLPIFKATAEWLNRYFNGENPNPDELPLSPSGSPFQLKVWEALSSIPYGKTITYGDLAKQLDTSPRAIGNAVGRNPIGIIIPCHRVIGAKGQLTGFAGGLDRKVWLLEHEKRGRSPF